MKTNMQFRPASDQSLLVSFGDAISLRAHERVRRFLHLLQKEPLTTVRNVHPAYCSVLVKFDPLAITHAELESILHRYLHSLDEVPLLPGRVVEVPVCYGGEFGPDLADVAALCKIPAERLIELHAAGDYLVYFLGFVPGFAYLGGLPEQLAAQRLATPRKSVPPGSVGIAGKQTGIYPFATPGGWRLIGRTPMPLFRVDDGASVLSVGTRVRFAAISPERFAALERACR